MKTEYIYLDYLENAFFLTNVFFSSLLSIL